MRLELLLVLLLLAFTSASFSLLACWQFVLRQYCLPMSLELAMHELAEHCSCPHPAHLKNILGYLLVWQCSQFLFFLDSSYCSMNVAWSSVVKTSLASCRMTPSLTVHSSCRAINVYGRA